jgi:hypothetical protein
MRHKTLFFGILIAGHTQSMAALDGLSDDPTIAGLQLLFLLGVALAPFLIVAAFIVVLIDFFKKKKEPLNASDTLQARATVTPVKPVSKDWEDLQRSLGLVYLLSGLAMLFLAIVQNTSVVFGGSPKFQALIKMIPFGISEVALMFAGFCFFCAFVHFLWKPLPLAAEVVLAIATWGVFVFLAVFAKSLLLGTILSLPAIRGGQTLKARLAS